MVIWAKKFLNDKIVVEGLVGVPHPKRGGFRGDSDTEVRLTVDTDADKTILSGGVVRRLGLRKEHLMSIEEIGDWHGGSALAGVVPGYLSVEHGPPFGPGPTEVTRFGLAFRVPLEDLGKPPKSVDEEKWERPDSLFGSDAIHFLTWLKGKRDVFGDLCVRFGLTREAAKMPTYRKRGVYSGGYRVRTVCSGEFGEMMRIREGQPLTRPDP